MIGKLVGHYQIESEIGAGGMGVLYKAEDTRLNRPVALKFLPPKYAEDRQALERFRREGRAASALNHPNICTIYGIDEHEGQPFIVMEYLEGQTVKERIVAGGFEVEELIEVGIQIGDALDAAHARGIIHRDIKPANIFITERGQAKALDFGLAKLVDDDASMGSQTRDSATEDGNLTNPGAAVGTVAYMSPEQARGEKVDSRTDLFAMGVVLYEMATGRQAFRGSSTAVLYDAILNRDPTPITDHDPDLPAELDQIVQKSLEKDRRLRYQHASELRTDLTRLKRTSDSGRLAAAAPRRDGSERTGNVWLALAGLVGLVGLAVAFIVVTGGDPPPAPVSEGSLAVMYFENLADADDSEGLGRMMTSLLTTELSRSGDMDVVSRQRLNDLARELGHETGPVDSTVATEVARMAGVGTMVLGQVAQAGERIVVSADLVDVETGRLIASPRAEGMSVDDVFSMAEDLGMEVRREMQTSTDVGGTINGELDASLTASVGAYRAYAEGDALFQEGNFEDAADRFREAAELDDRFAMAYYRMSVACFAAGDEVGAREASEDALNRIELLPDGLRDVVRANSLIMEGDWTGAISHVSTALEKDSQDREALWMLGALYLYSSPGDDPEQTAELLEQVERLDPNFDIVYSPLSWAYAYQGLQSMTMEEMGP